MTKFIFTARLAGVAALFLLAFQWTSAQTGTVRGTVKDAGGHPLAGASIIVESRKTGTTTDANGIYSLKLPPGKYTLTSSFVGQTEQHITVTISAGAKVEQDFVCTALSEMDNVVVVGSRSRDARSLISTTVPVDVIRTKDIKPFAQMDVSQMLTYAVPSF